MNRKNRTNKIGYRQPHHRFYSLRQVEAVLCGNAKIDGLEIVDRSKLSDFVPYTEVRTGKIGDLCHAEYK